MRKKDCAWLQEAKADTTLAHNRHILLTMPLITDFVRLIYTEA
jgi:hypothetical protein